MSGGSHHANLDSPNPEGLGSLAGRIEAATGVKLAHCYQCGKCAAECPVGDQMDMPPCQVFRLLQLEMPHFDEKVLKCEGIWLCMACETCATRCPQELEIPKVMDYIRSESLAKNLAHPKSRDVLAFHRSFLDSIEQTGRLYEIGLVAAYKVRSFHFMKDVLLAPKMFLKGKLGLLPHLVKNREGVKKIFRRVAK